MGIKELFIKKKFNSLQEEYTYNRDKEKRENINVDRNLFEFLVHDVFFITGKGVVVTGEVSLGSVHVNERVYLEKSNGQTKEVIINGIETFREERKHAAEGENVGIMLKNVKRKEVLKGNRLYK